MGDQRDPIVFINTELTARRRFHNTKTNADKADRLQLAASTMQQTPGTPNAKSRKTQPGRSSAASSPAGPAKSNPYPTTELNGSPAAKKPRAGVPTSAKATAEVQGALNEEAANGESPSA